MSTTDSTSATMLPAVAGQLETPVRPLPQKVMGEFPGMTPLEKLEADFRRMSAQNREAYNSTGHQKWNGMALAYTAAAEKVRRLRAKLGPNVAGKALAR